MNWQIFGRKTNGGCTSLSVACILFHGVVGVVKRLNVKQKQPQNAITMPPVILNLFNFVQFAYARHSSSKLDSALAQSQISGSHCEPSLSILRGQMLKRVQHDENNWHSRSEILKQVWYFARLFVPLAFRRKYSRSEKSKQVWYFARLFVPLPA